MVIVAQVSDLHLSPRVPERQAQAELVIAGINAAKPDLTVVTGDLTDDGWDKPEDLVWAKQWMDERLDSVYFAVPGNHDVGNFAGMENGEISQERIDRWNQVFGAMPTWHSDAWHLQGHNSMVFGSTLSPGPPPDEQAVNATGSHILKHHAVFMHTPLFITHPEEPLDTDAEYWLGSHIGREGACVGLNALQPRLIASGHVHQTKFDTNGKRRWGMKFRLVRLWVLWRGMRNMDARNFFQGTQIVWAPPASGTWVHAPGLPNPPAPERTGFVLHHLGEDGSVRSEVVACAPMLKTVFYDPTGAG